MKSQENQAALTGDGLAVIDCPVDFAENLKLIGGKGLVSNAASR